MIGLRRLLEHYFNKDLKGLEHYLKVLWPKWTPGGLNGALEVQMEPWRPKRSLRGLRWSPGGLNGTLGRPPWNPRDTPRDPMGPKYSRCCDLELKIQSIVLIFA